MTLVKDATGKYVNVPDGDVSTPATSDNATNSGVQDAASTVQPTTEGNTETTNSENGPNKVESDSEIETLVSDTIKKVLAEEAANVIEAKNTVAPELAYRRREGQYRAIDRILRQGGMDNQQADKAMVEIRRILSSDK